MKKIVHVIESAKGFLCDVEDYTRDVERAVTFTDFNCATKRLVSISGMLEEECWIGSTYIQFPRLTPIR